MEQIDGLQGHGRVPGLGVHQPVYTHNFMNLFEMFPFIVQEADLNSLQTIQ